MARLTAIQTDYWRFDSKEKASLIRRGPLNLPWPEMLRLNHLCCLETLQTKRWQRYLQDDEAYAQDLSAGLSSDSYPGLDLEFWPELLQKLASSQSPYRARYCSVWQLKADNSEPRQPDFQGLFVNHSLTHLGSLEVIRVDEARNPTKLAFVPLDEVAHLMLGRPALFRTAKLTYDDDRADEVVWIPLLYGISWMSSQAYDTDGSLTRWVGHTSLGTGGERRNLGVGIGHQDFTVHNPADPEKSILFGLGSVSEVSVALDMNDPKFEQKCRARGLTQEDVQRIIKGG